MPATLVSSTPSSLYAVPGKNYAPSAPLKELTQHQRHPTPNPLTAALAKKYQEYIQRDYTAWLEVLDIGRQIANLTLGKNLILKRNVNSGRLMAISKQDGVWSDYKTVPGQFQLYITKLLSEWLSSRPELDPLCPSTDDQIEEFIESIKIINDNYDEKFYTTDYETKEFKSAVEYGTWITRYRFDEDKDDIVCELLDFPACRWDMRYRAEESPYFIYQSKVSTASLAFKYDAEINSDGDADGEFSGLRYIEQIAKQGGNTVGNGKENSYGQYNNVPDENIVTEMWLQPEAYCDIQLPVSESTVSGQTIPKGNLMKLFPNGLCVTGINNMKTILQLSAENHKEHIVSGLYHVQSFSGIGKGVSDAVDATKELNDFHSQLFAHTRAHATPAWGYDSNLISEEQARDIGKPRKNIAIDFTNARENVTNINQVIQALVPGQPASGAFEMRQELKNDLQTAFQVSQETQKDDFGITSSTATGDQLRQQNAASLLSPQHLNKADQRRRAAIVYVNLFRKYHDSDKWFAYKDINGRTAWESFSNSIFAENVEVDFKVVDNSQIAEGPFANRQATMSLLTASGGIPGLIQALQMNPEVTAEIANIFGAKLSIPRKNDVARVCRRRIQQAKKFLGVEMQMQNILSGITGQSMDNATLPESIVSHLDPPITPREMYHMSKIQFLGELLDTDEMMFAPIELRDVISAMIDQHIECQAMSVNQTQFLTGAANLAANAPAILGEQLMTQNNQRMLQEAQQAQMQAQQQTDQQTAMVQGAAQLAQQNADAQIQHHAAEADHQRALAQNAQQAAIASAQQNQQHNQALVQQQNQASIDAEAQARDQQHQATQNALGHAVQLEAAKRAATNKPKTGASK